MLEAVSHSAPDLYTFNLYTQHIMRSHPISSAEMQSCCLKRSYSRETLWAAAMVHISHVTESMLTFTETLEMISRLFSLTIHPMVLLVHEIRISGVLSR